MISGLLRLRFSQSLAKIVYLMSNNSFVVTQTVIDNKTHSYLTEKKVAHGKSGLQLVICKCNKIPRSRPLKLGRTRTVRLGPECGNNFVRLDTTIVRLKVIIFGKHATTS